MPIKFLLYTVVSPFVIIALNSLNINSIFKKGKVFEARLFMFLIGLALIYLVTNCIYDIATFSKIS